MLDHAPETGPRTTLIDVLGSQEAVDELRRLWDSTPPAPDFPEFVHWAMDGCVVHAGFDISVCEKSEQDAIFLVAVDVAPEGEDAVMRACAEKLREIAVAGNWDEWLDGGDDE